MWTVFLNSDSSLLGYKDKNGVVRIEPKFMGFTIANKFDKIIAVTEEVNGSYKSYYLTKTGKIIGRDSLHIFDNGPDCESEGFIRFRVSQTDKVGMFNSNGKIVIPAEYDALTRVKNGMVVGLKGAKKKFWDKEKHSDKHFSWTGGKEVLITVDNKIIIDNFANNYHLNFNSLVVTAQPTSDLTRETFRGIDSKYYSFVDFDKEFKHWLKTSVLDNLNKDKLINNSREEITYWKESTGWTSEPKLDFIERNFDLLRSKLLVINSKDCDYNIFNEGLNRYIFKSDKYSSFYNTCGESKDWIYPVKNIVVNYKTKSELYQDHFEFLRTDTGYELISVSIKSGEIK
ncbi:MAG: hypothetical protein IM631_18715 [Cytophagales bacterium]|nr:hypothetical protein [Cytophagales bacterium]MCA6373404.1 hypothetical protein [Cytophagales bacterium]MCA6377148.1 hypothetical protein [Cytophagales bacterium]MCA6383077.1 hypothetical protein [Cytophagales bacterium]